MAMGSNKHVVNPSRVNQYNVARDSINLSDYFGYNRHNLVSLRWMLILTNNSSDDYTYLPNECKKPPRTIACIKAPTLAECKTGLDELYVR